MMQLLPKLMLWCQMMLVYEVKGSGKLHAWTIRGSLRFLKLVGLSLAAINSKVQKSVLYGLYCRNWLEFNI